MLINEKLQKIRKKHKLTRKGLEVISGFKERTIGSYERNEREPSKEYITFISLYFDVKMSDLLDNNYILEDIRPNQQVKRYLLMYQDIYNLGDNEFNQILIDNNLDYQMKIMEYGSLRHYCSNDFKDIIMLSMLFKIRPSQLINFHINMLDRKINDSFMFCDNKDKTITKEWIKENFIKLENSINELDINYYAKIIKKRNEEIKNYTPDYELKEVDISSLNDNPKHKKIIELLPYASDKFLDTIYHKLEQTKAIQQL